MNELSLFTGAGGGVYASKLLGHQIVGYVEKDPFCQKVIEARINDRIFDKAPLFGSIEEFIETGQAKKFKGQAELVSAGFPCQPFSISGKRKKEKDERNKWPETIAVIRAVQPRYAFLENVAGLLNSGYFETILGDLAETGFDARWCVLGASDCGGQHIRKRLWILANAKSERIQRLWPRRQRIVPAHDEEKIFMRSGERITKTDWKVEPRMDRVVDGMADRLDRIKALGNGQVPQVAATAFNLLINQI